MRRNGSACALAALALALAGCASEDAPPEPAPVESVESAIFRGGIAQDIRCEPAEGLEARGKAVFRCSYEEEKSMSGAMRPVDKCYVLEGEKLVDVTNELPRGTDCTVSAP